LSRTATVFGYELNTGAQNKPGTWPMIRISSFVMAAALLRPDPIVDGCRRSDWVDIWSRLRQIDRMELGEEILVPSEIDLIAFDEGGCRTGAFRLADGESLSRSALPRRRWRDR
jgi:hypothetical protein